MKIFKNSEVKRLSFLFAIVLIIVLILAVASTEIIIKSYEQYFINYNAKVISAVIKKYPETESEVIEEILSADSKDGLKELEKYGINEESIMSLVSPIRNEFNRVLYTIIALSVTIYVVLVVIVVIFLSKLYQKIRKLSDYTLNIAYRNYDIGVRDNNEGDISILKNHLFDITRILKENNELLEQDKLCLKDAIADISHQLKTPLTSLYLVNEILNDEQDEMKRQQFLIQMREELERIEWLVSSLLKMSKLDSKTIILRNEEVDVSSLIQSSINDLHSLIDNKKIRLNIAGENKITIIGDFNWLKEALINIIKNAIEHNCEGGSINITLITNPLYTKITIIDNGEGISSTDLPHIFERFYKAKGSSKNSVGIGLALAKSIINSQNGDISVTSKLGEYTKFTIKMYHQQI